MTYSHILLHPLTREPTHKLNTRTYVHPHHHPPGTTNLPPPPSPFHPPRPSDPPETQYRLITQTPTDNPNVT